MENKALLNPLKILIDHIKNANASLQYKLAEMRNHYPCKAVGQKTVSPGRTIILYTILGKRHLHEIPIQSLMENNELINQFPPAQAVKFGAIALGDLLFSLPESERKEKYEAIKSKMLIKEAKDVN